MTTLKCVAGAALLLMATAAQAQYVWIDAKGSKQFSDRAPPASVPLDKILKSPRPLVNPADPAQAPAAAAKPAPEADNGVAAREADYRKRKADQAEKEKEAAAKAAGAAQRNARCNQARAAQAQLANGGRVRNPDGSYLDDAQRAQMNERASAMLQECAKTGG